MNILIYIYICVCVCIYIYIYIYIYTYIHEIVLIDISDRFLSERITVRIYHLLYSYCCDYFSNYYATSTTSTMRPVHFQFIFWCVHRGIIDRKWYVIASNYAGICYTEKMFSWPEWSATEQKVGECELILRPTEKMVSILKKMQKIIILIIFSVSSSLVLYLIPISSYTFHFCAPVFSCLYYKI